MPITYRNKCTTCQSALTEYELQKQWLMTRARSRVLKASRARIRTRPSRPLNSLNSLLLLSFSLSILSITRSTLRRWKNGRFLRGGEKEREQEGRRLAQIRSIYTQMKTFYLHDFHLCALYECRQCRRRCDVMVRSLVDLLLSAVLPNE